MSEDALRKLGKGFVRLYTLLWSQDESMMQVREIALADRASEKGKPSATETISLGMIDDIRPRLPMTIEFGGHRFRIIELDGKLAAHSTQCPHLFGPLDDCAIRDGGIVCPWHGYEFDILTGRSADGRSLRLRQAPTVEIDSSGAVVVEVKERLSSSSIS